MQLTSKQQKLLAKKIITSFQELQHFWGRSWVRTQLNALFVQMNTIEGQSPGRNSLWKRNKEKTRKEKKSILEKKKKKK